MACCMVRHGAVGLGPPQPWTLSTCHFQFTFSFFLLFMIEVPDQFGHFRQSLISRANATYPGTTSIRPLLPEFHRAPEGRSQTSVLIRADPDEESWLPRSLHPQ
jgi:hypothetical protein